MDSENSEYLKALLIVDLQMARESALLGLYEKSRQYYRAIIANDRNRSNIRLVEAELLLVEELIATVEGYCSHTNTIKSAAWDRFNRTPLKAREIKARSSDKPLPSSLAKSTKPKKKVLNGQPMSKSATEPTDATLNRDEILAKIPFEPSGHDKEHIELIMRDVIQISSTKWCDISGLAESKSLLQEAIVLPLLMPDYFKGLHDRAMYNL